MSHRQTRTLLGTLALATLLGFGAAPALAGGCATVDLEAPVVLPGGHVLEDGRLSVCPMASFSPSVALHAVRWNGHAVALMTSRQGRAEVASSGQPFFSFARDVEGRLHLRAFATPDAGGYDTFRPMPVGRRPGDEPIPRVTTEQIILVASAD